jgi:hypothetical protein
MSNLENLAYKTLESTKESIAGAFASSIILLFTGFFFWSLEAEEIAGMAFGYGIFMLLVAGYFYISYRSRSKKCEEAFPK